jgi:hypothetical protein
VNHQARPRWRSSSHRGGNPFECHRCKPNGARFIPGHIGGSLSRMRPLTNTGASHGIESSRNSKTIVAANARFPLGRLIQGSVWIVGRFLPLLRNKKRRIQFSFLEGCHMRSHIRSADISGWMQSGKR